MVPKFRLTYRTFAVGTLACLVALIGYRAFGFPSQQEVTAKPAKPTTPSKSQPQEHRDRREIPPIENRAQSGPQIGIWNSVENVTKVVFSRGKSVDLPSSPIRVFEDFAAATTAAMPSPDDLSRCKRILAEARARSKKGEALTNEEMADCAVAATILVAAGEKVDKFGDWVNDDTASSLVKDAKTRLSISVDDVRLAHDAYNRLFAFGQASREAGNLDDAVTAFKGVAELAGRLPSLPDAKNPADDAAFALGQLAATYFQRADLRDARNDKGGSDDRRDGMIVIQQLMAQRPVLVVDAAQKEAKIGVGIPSKEPDFESLWLFKPLFGKTRFELIEASIKDQNSTKVEHFIAVKFDNRGDSFNFTRFVQVSEPQRFLLRWSWKLDNAPPKADNEAKHSSNHPLNVIVGFKPNSEGKLVLLHYVFDPSATTGATWTDDLHIEFPLLGDFVPVVSPHVVASSSEELGQWHTCQQDIEADYRKFYSDGPLPKIGGVAIQTHMENRRSKAVGSIGNIMFVKKPTDE